MTMQIQMNEDCREFLSELADFIECDVSVLNQFYRDFSHPPRWGGGTVEPAVGQMLYILTRFYAPIIALEIGTNLGYSTFCIASAMKQNKLGKLMTWDINPEFSSEAEARLWALRDYLDFRIGDSTRHLEATLVENFVIPDMIFIDSEHTYETTKIELEIAVRRIASNGVILLHDIFSDGVKKCLEEFDYPGLKILQIPTQPNTGFGIIKTIL